MAFVYRSQAIPAYPTHPGPGHSLFTQATIEYSNDPPNRNCLLLSTKHLPAKYGNKALFRDQDPTNPRKKQTRQWSSMQEPKYTQSMLLQKQQYSGRVLLGLDSNSKTALAQETSKVSSMQHFLETKTEEREEYQST